MTAASFDVYLTGARDASPSGQMRIAAAIASRYRLAAPMVAAVLADGGNCRVGERLSEADAQAVVDALETLGATARLVPAGLPPGVSPPVEPAPVIAPRRPPSPARSPLAEPPSLDIDLPAGDTVRCPIHGLAYDRRRASGCVRCLAPARARARTLEETTGIAGPRRLADSPARRAFWGLAVALLVGFLPTAYYARSIHRGQLEKLRAEQAELSSRPATPESLARFDALDADVARAHLGGAGRALLIWLVAGGLVAGVWARLTAPRPA